MPIPRRVALGQQQLTERREQFAERYAGSDGFVQGLPHPVRLVINRFDGELPRYDVKVGHPLICSGSPAECPVAEFVDNEGIAADFFTPWPQVDELTDEDCHRLSGTIKYVVIHRVEVLGRIDHEFSWLDEAGQ